MNTYPANWAAMRDGFRAWVQGRLGPEWTCYWSGDSDSRNRKGTAALLPRAVIRDITLPDVVGEPAPEYRDQGATLDVATSGYGEAVIEVQVHADADVPARSAIANLQVGWAADDTLSGLGIGVLDVEQVQDLTPLGDRPRQLYRFSIEFRVSVCVEVVDQNVDHFTQASATVEVVT